MSSFAVTPSVALNPWVQILAALEKKINRHAFDTWLKPTRFSYVRERMLYVRIPTPEFKHVGERYGDLIQEAIENLHLEFDDVTFITAEEDPTLPRVREDGGFAPASSTEIPVRTNGAARTMPAGGPQQARFDWSTAAQLNARYTFDAFVCGPGNQFARAAAMAVAEQPSRAYNPLFLYGGVGMGKTHLMHAIGHEMKRRQPDASISYVSAEKFTNEMISSVVNFSAET